MTSTRFTGAATREEPVLLDVAAIGATYVESIQALHDVSLRVRRGEIVAVLGANGAGKTTLMRAVSNLLPAERGRVTRGAIQFDGHDALRRSPGALVRLGLVPVLEGRRCFRSMTVEENLIIGAITRGSGRHATRCDLDFVYAIFPRLAEKRGIAAGRVSGGEQQMAAIGRALMARPRLLLLDEPSMGLAPLVIRDIFDTLATLNRDSDLTVVFSEQNARLAAAYAHRSIVLTSGVSSTFDPTPSAIDSLYLGELTDAGSGRGQMPVVTA